MSLSRQRTTAPVPLLGIALLLLLAFLEPSATSAIASPSPNPYLEFVSCDQCTIFSKALWCPSDFRCHFYNETPHGKHQISLPENTTAAEDCADKCGGDACVGFLDCFFGVSSCGECMYLGGAWCPSKKKCFPRDLLATDGSGGVGDNSNGTTEAAKKHAAEVARIDEEFSCSAQCGGSGGDDDGDDHECQIRDDQCPPCERYDVPLRCSRTLPVLIVSVISSIIFVVALTYTLFPAHGNRKREIGPGTHIGPITGNLMESPAPSTRDPGSEKLFNP